MAQLARIGTIMEQRQGLKENLWGSNKKDKEDRDEEEEFQRKSEEN